MKTKKQSKNQSNNNKNKNETIQNKIRRFKKVKVFGKPLIALLTEVMPFWYWTIFFLAGRTSGHLVFTAKL